METKREFLITLTSNANGEPGFTISHHGDARPSLGATLQLAASLVALCHRDMHRKLDQRLHDKRLCDANDLLTDIIRDATGKFPAAVQPASCVH